MKVSRGLRDAARDFVGFEIKEAERGNPRAAFGVLESFCDAVENGNEVDRRILLYLARAFRKITVEGKAPLRADKALGLQRPKHRRASRKVEERNMDIAREVFRRLKNGTQTNETDAIAATAERRRITDHHVKKVIANRSIRQAAQIIENYLPRSSYRK